MQNLKTQERKKMSFLTAIEEEARRISLRIAKPSVALSISQKQEPSVDYIEELDTLFLIDRLNRMHAQASSRKPQHK